MVQWFDFNALSFPPCAFDDLPLPESDPSLRLCIILHLRFQIEATTAKAVLDTDAQLVLHTRCLRPGGRAPYPGALSNTWMRDIKSSNPTSSNLI